jgi:hypothetical protein
MPDFFDRLVARHTPDSGAGGALRARPRLPGPFERTGMTATTTGPALLDAERPAAPLPTTAPRPSPAPTPAAFRPSAGREQPSTVQVPLTVREHAAPDRGALVAPALPQTAVLLPVSEPERRRKEREQAVARPERLVREITDHQENILIRKTAREIAPHATAVPAAVPTTPRTPARAVTSAAKQPVGRTKGPQRVVHVSIGRLEVKAAGRRPESDARGGRAERSGRGTPALSLEKYLSREGAQR